MKITFLGSSHGVPEPNRKTSCTMIEVNGRYYFIDIGIQLINELITRGVSINDVKSIFLTHMHGDHSNGLPAFVDLASWYFKTVDPDIYLPNIEAVDGINAWVRVTGIQPREMKYHEISEGIIFDDGVLNVTAISTKHCDRSHAFLVRAEGKTILFTGDLARPGIDFPAAAKEEEIDLAVCESAHFSPLEYAPIFAESNIKKVCINHYVKSRFADILQLTNEINPIPVLIATDNMEINL